LKTATTKIKRHNTGLLIQLKNMERRIVHCDLYTFFVSVERLQNSKLIGVPVLIGGSSDRGIVASCSYQTDLFDDSAEEVNLMQAMDKIRKRYGAEFLMRAICAPLPQKGGEHALKST